MNDEQKRATQILAVSVDGAENLQMMVDRVAKEDGIVLEYPLLEDLEHRVIDRYGLFNMNDPKGREITHPATFVIDREGVVQWRLIELNYKVRPTNEDILVALAALP